ncbi:hypothetical protein LCGC14_3130060 [marine sediment metagenome]|uniref:Uncharacterized protein n=1 Tax=marine sediment metagenome TaxID=412755 RepID=A0A0F8Y715_9ZZZZ
MEKLELCQCNNCKGETTEAGRKACKKIRDKYLNKKGILC